MKIVKKQFYLLSIKKAVFPLIIFGFTICLILFSNSNLTAAKKGLSLWANSVVPSLLPFFIATELLIHTPMIPMLGRILTPIMKPIFRIRGEGSFALLMGFISGYPTGAKIASNFRENKICTKEECERLLSFTNNSGPLFIVGTVGISMFGSTTIGILLLITHILASLSTGFCFRFWKPPHHTRSSNSYFDTQTNNSYVKISNLGEMLGNSIMNSISTILMIGGFIVIFSVIISIFNTSQIFILLSYCLSPIFDTIMIPSKFIIPILTGILEITNGINLISNIPMRQLSINILITSFLLGFGGISVLLQVLSITSKTDLSIKPYIIGKILHGIFAVIYTFILITIFPIFNFNL